MNRLYKQLVFIFTNRIVFSSILIVLVLILGVTGFVGIEGYTLLEAVYMTVITVSTVGYTEVRPLTDLGRLFTSVLILANLISLTYAFTTLSAYIFDINVIQRLERRRMKQRIEELRNHVVVCGFGRIGRQVCQELALEGLDFVVIETKPEVIDQLKSDGKYLYLAGEATDDNLLMQANLREAQALIATMPSDSDNVYVTLAAREMNPNIKIISRVTNEMSESKLRRAGCNHSILPEKISGSHMAALVSQPDLYRFINYLTEPGNNNIYSEQLCFPDGMEKISLSQLRIREKSGVTVIGLQDPTGKYIINPNPDLPIAQGSILFVLGNEQQIAQYKQLISSASRQLRADL
jgi:voltage-gated potassium channel